MDLSSLLAGLFNGWCPLRSKGHPQSFSISNIRCRICLTKPGTANSFWYFIRSVWLYLNSTTR